MASPDEIKLLTCTQHQRLCVYPSIVYMGPSRKLNARQCKFDIQIGEKTCTHTHFHWNSENHIMAELQKLKQECQQREQLCCTPQ